MSAEGLRAAAQNFGLGENFAADNVADAISCLKATDRPLANAVAAATAVTVAGEGASLELLALWAADAVLARALRWPHPVTASGRRGSAGEGRGAPRASG